MNDNVDVEMTLANGKRYHATFFTLRNIESLFEKNRETGECAEGLYLWASNMILVKKLDHETLIGTIAGLISEGELDAACLQIGDAEQVSGTNGT